MERSTVMKRRFRDGRYSIIQTNEKQQSRTYRDSIYCKSIRYKIYRPEREMMSRYENKWSISKITEKWGRD